jgi:phosphatidylinositol dimannoside acyltransferase
MIVDTIADTFAKQKSYRHWLSVPSFYRLGFAAAQCVPASVLYGVADILGLVTYLICRAPVRIVHANLVQAFPGASNWEVSRLAAKIFRNYARYLVDYGRFRWVPQEGSETVIPVLEGKENLQAAFDADKGVILVTGHVGNWELGGVSFGLRGIKVNVVTLPDGSNQIDAIRRGYRGRYSIKTIVLDGTPFASLEMMTALKRGEVVAMLVDRWGRADGVVAPFFGGVHYLPRGPFVLSRMTGAPILPAFVVRDGTSYRGILEPPFVVEEDDLHPYALRVSNALEAVIRRYPDQWYNFVPL